MASGPALYVVRVEHRVSSLQLLCQQAIASALREDKDVSKLTLPPRLCSYLSTAFIPTIKVEPSPSSCPRGAGQAGKGGEGPGAGARESRPPLAPGRVCVARAAAPPPCAPTPAAREGVRTSAFSQQGQCPSVAAVPS